MKNQIKGNKGITLIALVITIIVLLILTGITIAMLTGENGILNNATKSKAYNELGTAKDQVGLKVSEAVTDYFNKIYVKGKDTSATPDTTQGSGNYSASGAQSAAITAVSTMTLPTGVSFVKANTADPNVSSSGVFTLRYGDYTVQGTIGASGSLTWLDIEKNPVNNS